DEKGSAVGKEGHGRRQPAPGARDVGTAEGRESRGGRGKGGEMDVVVCGGFVGNAILKFYGSGGRMFGGMLQQAVPDVLGRPEVKQLFKFLDYSEYGGAPLLGVKGVAIICHGASLARAIMNAVRVAAQMVTSHL